MGLNEVECGRADGDDEIDPVRAVLDAELIHQTPLLRQSGKAQEVEVLRVNLYAEG